MKYISVVVDDLYSNNNLFSSNTPLNRDDCLLQYIELKNKLLKYRIDISTYDINSIENSSIVFFLNAPTLTNRYYKKAVILKKKIIIIENEHFDIHKPNRNIENLKGVTKVFSYRPYKYKNGIYLNYSFNFSRDKKSFDIKRKKIFSCLISNNKMYSISDELYSERKKIIKWFNKNAVKDFALYGGGWDKVVLKSNNLLFKLINRLNINSKRLNVYRGKCKSKSEILSKSKFSFCFENSNTQGWITEKLFDVMRNNCVPIYYGTSEVKKYVPSDLFINYEEFNSVKDLYGFLKGMSSKTHNEYLIKINSFINNLDNKFPFHLEYHNKTLINFIIKEI